MALRPRDLCHQRGLGVGLALAARSLEQAAGDLTLAQYRLDQPIPVQYVYWMKGVLSGNLGESMRLKSSVSSLVAEKLPVTLQLAGMALLIAALRAKGTSEIGNIRQIDRGYENIDQRLRDLGAHIERIATEPVHA